MKSNVNTWYQRPQVSQRQGLSLDSIGILASVGQIQGNGRLECPSLGYTIV